MTTRRETLDAIRDAVNAHIEAHHEPSEGEVVTDLVIVAGWVNVTLDEQADGVHLITTEQTPGYTARGLLATAGSIFDASPTTDD